MQVYTRANNTQLQKDMSIPIIPGWNRETNRQVCRGRTKNMDYRSAGVGAAPVRHVESTGNATLLTGSKAAFDTNMTGGVDPYMQSSSKIGDGIGSELHVSQQPKVLRSFGYYREAISESSEETFRDRQISILIYLSDGTCEINEPKVQNSGIPQGKILNRGPLKTEDGELIGPGHLLPGTFLKVYGKMMKVCRCDPWTRDWLSNRGLVVGEDCPIPQNGASRVLAKLPEWNGKVHFPLKMFMEASMGKHNHDSKATKQFLDYDQDKLRFSLVWDNSDALFGDIMDYSMLYYLCDDTVQIQQSRRANTGREEFPTLFKRDQLLKDWKEFLHVHHRQVGAKYGDGEIWTWRDFRVGMTFNMFGREMRVTAVDFTTREFFAKQGIELKPNERWAGEVVERPMLPHPQFNGYGDKFHAGTEWKSLVPKQPKKDYNKIIGLDGHRLRMTARILSDNPDDEKRGFVITYFLHDDTLLVFEPPIRNSGIVGGKFLEKGKFEHENGARYICPDDFQVGQVTKINYFDFIIDSLVHDKAGLGE